MPSDRRRRSTIGTKERLGLVACSVVCLGPRPGTSSACATKVEPTPLSQKDTIRVGCVCGDAARAGHNRPYMKINENKRIQSIVQRMNTGSQRLKRPDLAYDSVDAHGNGLLRKNGQQDALLRDLTEFLR
jgi:hypothetical protein